MLVLGVLVVLLVVMVALVVFLTNISSVTAWLEVSSALIYSVEVEIFLLELLKHWSICSVEKRRERILCIPSLCFSFVFSI